MNEEEQKAYDKGYEEGHRQGGYEAEDEFFVCEHHQGTGGYESCCACSEGRPCTEAE